MTGLKNGGLQEMDLYRLALREMEYALVRGHLRVSPLPGGHLVPPLRKISSLVAADQPVFGWAVSLARFSRSTFFS